MSIHVLLTYINAENLHDVEMSIANERHGRYREARPDPVAETNKKTRTDQCSILLDEKDRKN